MRGEEILLNIVCVWVFYLSVLIPRYHIRLEVPMKIMKIKELAVKDLEHYCIKMKELETVIADERHLQDFLTIKFHRRSGQENHPHSPQGRLSLLSFMRYVCL